MNSRTAYFAMFVTATLLLVFAVMAEAQETQYTKCVNGKGEVVIVTNWTCPKGYWPN